MVRFRQQDTFAMRWGLWLLAGLLLCLPSQVPARGDIASLYADIVPVKYKKGIFWKIERKGLKPSYLLGTIHIDDPRVTNLPPVIQKAFDQSRTVCTEVKMDFKMMAIEMKEMYFSDGRNLKVLLGGKMYAKVKRIMTLKYGLPESFYYNMKPFSLAYVMNVPPRYMGMQVLDLRLYTNAIRARKKVCGLETYEEHGKAFNFLSVPDQVEVLRDTVNHIEQIHKLFEVMLKAWIDRDLHKLVVGSTDVSWGGDRRIIRQVVDKLVIKRNRIMHKRMQPHLKQGNAFFAVGTLHLTGRMGLLRMLERSGYKVTRLY